MHLRRLKTVLKIPASGTLVNFRNHQRSGREREIISTGSLIPLGKYLMGGEESPSFEDVFLPLLLFLFFLSTTLFFFLLLHNSLSLSLHLFLFSSLNFQYAAIFVCPSLLVIFTNLLSELFRSQSPVFPNLVALVCLFPCHLSTIPAFSPSLS